MRTFGLVLIFLALAACRPPPPWLSASPAELAVMYAELDQRVCASKLAYAGVEWTTALEACRPFDAAVRGVSPWK